MNNLAFMSAIIGSAAFGAVAGKLLEAFLLAPIVDRYEKKKWLRQTKIEAFTKLTEEFLSLGLHSMVHDDLWKFRSLSAKAILLLEDEQLIQDIEKLIEAINKLSYDPSSIVKSNLPDDFMIELPGGFKGTKKHLELGIAAEAIGKEAMGIAKRLGGDLRKT